MTTIGVRLHESLAIIGRAGRIDELVAHRPSRFGVPSGSPVIALLPGKLAHDLCRSGVTVTAIERSEITHLLQRWAGGNREALDQIMPVVYDRLRQIAHQRLRHGPGGGSLNTSDLVHEAYVKLVDAPKVSLQDRSHFLALASRVMRNLLVDHARARQAAKRGGRQIPVDLELAIEIPEDKLEVVTELDQALKRLELLDARQSGILEQRYFGGLSLEETAAVFGISLATVKRELRSARAWLAVEIRNEPRL